MLQFLLNDQRLSLGLEAVLGLSLQTSMRIDRVSYYLDGHDLVSDRGSSASSRRPSLTETLPVAICIELYANRINVLFEDGMIYDGGIRRVSMEDIDEYLC
jgi:hypothetical protein